MKYIHTRRLLNAGEVVQLDCDTQCHLMLLTDEHFAAYQAVRDFAYEGGTFKKFPAPGCGPETAYWNVVIDLNGAAKPVQYNITIVLD